FEMVGVQFDQARHDEIATCVVAPVGRVALPDFGDAAIGKGDPATLDHAIRKHQARVTDDGVGLGRSHLIVFLHAAAAKEVTSTTRSAIWRRISSSCTIATMATPARFFWSIRPTTTSRLAASSEAVGSSRSRIG